MEDAWIPKLGDEFYNFQKLERLMDEYERRKHQCFTLHTTKIENSRFKGKVPNEEKLKYLYVCFKCEFFGEARTCATKRKTKTLKKGCSAIVKAKLNLKLLDRLELYEVHLTHENHNNSELFWNLLPKNRRLSPNTKEEVKKALQMGCKVQLLKNDLAVNRNKILCNKDLANIKAETKKIEKGNELAPFVELLHNKYGCTTELSYDGKSKAFKGLYFCNEQMRNAMSSWPEMVLIDGTYKLFNRGFTLLLFAVQNGIKRREVVGSAILASEDKGTLKWAVETFKKRNFEACKKIKCIMTDKDMTERAVLKEVLPDAHLLLCIFHTLKAFSRALLTLNLNKEEKKKWGKILQSLAYSCSHAEYQKCYDLLINEAPQRLIDYFNKHWHNIQDEWVHYSMAQQNFGNFTNNLLESINHLIKLLVEKNSTLCNFAHRYFAFIRSHTQETDIRSAMEILKTPTKILTGDYGNSTRDYCGYLCQHAFNEVEKELQLLEFITLKVIDKTDKICSIIFKNGSIKATPTDCTCEFKTAHKLPCRHIFAVRNFFEMPLFDPSLCDQRFTKNYTLQNHRLNDRRTSKVSAPIPDSPIIRRLPHKTPVTVSEKRKLASLVAADLVDTVTSGCGLRFDNQISAIKELIQAFRVGEAVQIVRTQKKSDPNPEICSNDKLNKENISTENVQRLNLDDVAMPAARRVLGRPNGFESTTPSFSPRKQSTKLFFEKSLEDQQRLFLSWLLPPTILKVVINAEYKVRLQDLCHFNDKTLKNSVASHAINLHDFYRFFEVEAFNFLSELVTLKRINESWSCVL